MGLEPKPGNLDWGKCKPVARRILHERLAGEEDTFVKGRNL